MLKDDLQPTDAFRKMKIMPNKLIKIFFILLSCLIRLDVNSLSGIEIKIIFLFMKLKLIGLIIQRKSNCRTLLIQLAL